jgi:hypothetical protein
VYARGGMRRGPRSSRGVSSWEPAERASIEEKGVYEPSADRLAIAEPTDKTSSGIPDLPDFLDRRSGAENPSEKSDYREQTE